MAKGQFQSSKGTYGVDVEWTSTPDVEKNTSTVEVAVYIRYYSISIPDRRCYCTLDGQTREITVPGIRHSGSAQRRQVAAFSFEVAHEEDGTKVCSLCAGFAFALNSASLGYLETLEAGGQIVLDTIARAAVLRATGGVIGGLAELRWRPSHASHTFRLLSEDGSLDMTFAPGTTQEQMVCPELTEQYLPLMTGTPPVARLPVTLITLYEGEELGRSRALLTLTMPPYSMPVVAVRSCYRANAAQLPDSEGTFLWLEAECYVNQYEKDTTAKNTYSLCCAVNGELVYRGDEHYGNVPGVTLDPAQAYRVQIWVEDSTDSSVVNLVDIPTAAADFHLRQGGNGAAFGCYATREKALQLADGWTLYLGDTSLEAYIRQICAQVQNESE